MALIVQQTIFTKASGEEYRNWGIAANDNAIISGIDSLTTSPYAINTKIMSFNTNDDDIWTYLDTLQCGVKSDYLVDTFYTFKLYTNNDKLVGHFKCKINPNTGVISELTKLRTSTSVTTNTTGRSYSFRDSTLAKELWFHENMNIKAIVTPDYIPPNIKFNIGGVWKTYDKGYCMVGGAYKEFDTIWVNIGGVWKKTE